MDEVGILVVNMQDILHHTQNQTGNSENLTEGTETERTGDGDE